MRQQYANALNIKIAQFAVEMVRNFKQYMKDSAAPDIALDSFGYMYLAQSVGFAKQLQRQQQLQASLGAGTQIMTTEEIARHYLFSIWKT